MSDDPTTADTPDGDRLDHLVDRINANTTSMDNLRDDGDRLDHLVTRIDANTASLHALRDEAVDENQKRDKRIRWSRIVSIVAIAFGVIGLAVGVIGVRDANTAQDSADTIVAVRVQGRTATCNGFEAFANALIASAKPSTTLEEHMAAQARLDAFKADLEARTAVLDCHFNFISAG